MKLTIDSYGCNRWLNDKGKYHNIVESAVTHSGVQFWHRNGKKHRLDGPAEIYLVGPDYWFWLGKRCTEQQHTLISNKRFFTRRVKI